MRTLVFGDSIAAGRDAVNGGWVQRLIQDDFAAISSGDKTFPATYNLGVGGDLAGDVLARFENETKARMTGDPDLAVIFAVGINDSRIGNARTGATEPESSPDRYLSELEALCDLAQKYTGRIIFVGLTPVDETHEIVGQHWNNARIQQFDAVLKACAADRGAPYIPVFDALSKIPATELFSDGLHLTEIGHHEIYEAVGLVLKGLQVAL